MKSKISLIFSHIFVTKKLVVRRSREIRQRITSRVDFCERDLHARLVGDADVEGAIREGRGARAGMEEDKSLARSYHNTVLPGKRSQGICRATDREGVGCLLLDDQCTKTRQLVLEVLWEKQPETQVPP